MQIPENGEIASFYRAAVAGLRALEARTGRRRFGADADAAWKAFRGELTDGDRLDLLVRDAAVSHPAAFASRVVFTLQGLAADEPFGPDWPGTDAASALAFLREAAEPASQVAVNQVLATAAAAWAVVPSPFPAATLADIGPATRIVAAGTGAIVALGCYFGGRVDMDLAEQVIVVTERPADRQLFGLAAVTSGKPAVLHILTPSAASRDAARAAGFANADRVLVSDDASPAAYEAATALAHELGA
jgi:hypothetical protein